MSQSTQQFRNITYLSDVTGTGFWRHIQQILATNGVAQQFGLNNTFTQQPILDKDYYNGITSVTVQRWISPMHHQIFMRRLRPLCDINNAWLIYGIDDAMHFDEIPQYNRGREAFENPQTQTNIKEMLNAADFVVVTTNHIKEYYHRKYGVPLKNIIAFPNLLPRWWFDGKYSLQTSLENKTRFKAKPRIGIISSLSHYNIDNVRTDKNGYAVRRKKDDKDKPIVPEVWINQIGEEVDVKDTMPVLDDVDEILETIKSTVNDVQWVFFGYCPESLKQYVDAKKIEVHSGVAILNYPQVLKNLCLQAIVAPLKKIEFNYCKSPIKFIECCALGIPLLAANCEPYTTCMDRSMLFDNPEELKEKLLKLKFSSNGAYSKIIEQNYKWLNSPHEDGDFKLNNYWLEDNLHIWIDFFRLRQKFMHISFASYRKQYEERCKREKENVIFSNNGVEILK